MYLYLLAYIYVHIRIHPASFSPAIPRVGVVELHYCDGSYYCDCYGSYYYYFYYYYYYYYYYDCYN